MTYAKKFTVAETIAFSTSVAALNILQGGSDALLDAFSCGAFVESAEGITLRSPELSVSELEQIGALFFLMQVNALETEMQALGIQVARNK
jgi:hypothetical protein